jgi:DNA recombination protein RmuC
MSIALGCLLLGGVLGWVLGQRKSALLAAEHAKAQAESKALERLLEEKERSWKEAQEKNRLEFENLSNRILKQQTADFQAESQSKIEELLSPLKQKMEVFQSNIQEISKAGTAERLALKYKIDQVSDCSKLLAEETHHLARVLKGDVKKQGIWGELVLQKVLETSGLRENEEYTLQAAGMNLTSEEGRRLQPDVLLHLPDSKQIIIDSKMSYTHYEDYFNADGEEKKVESLKKLIASLKEHVKELSEKKYQFAKNVDNPGFVLLFVPVEAIFSLVIQAEPSLFEEAWKKSIIIVSPANILAILRTIESIWKVERQNRNTQKIAEDAAALYDKFVDLLKDLESAHRCLQGAEEAFEKAFNKLSNGRGNLVKKTEDLKKLGLKTKKQIPELYLREEENQLV